MGTSGSSQSRELIVADDGSIPADQVCKLGLEPGARLRAVEVAPGRRAGRSGVVASLPGPELGGL